MSVFREGELEFAFGASWEAELFDQDGASWPQGMKPVDFIAEGENEIVLVEVKDPSALAGPGRKHDMKLRCKNADGALELTVSGHLAPKARTTYGFLHLMARDAKPMRYVVVIGIERLSIEPPLLMNLTDRLKARLRKEADEAWKREYMSSCIVVGIEDMDKALSGCSVKRLP